MNSYLIRCLTNLHVGSGDSDFGVIDNLVQRDCITELPIIHSSSLKGALREYFEAVAKAEVEHIFGSKNEENNSNPTNPGKYKFFQANLLAIPVRSSKKAYYLATSPMLLKEFKENVKCSQIVIGEIKTILNNIKPAVFHTDDTGEIEGIPIPTANVTANCPKLKELLNCSDLVILTDEQLKDICSTLPVLARNHLENGISKNLWYEEIVPRESRFYFNVYVPDKDNLVGNFEKQFEAGNIQIGANATIGYGYCNISKIM